MRRIGVLAAIGLLSAAAPLSAHAQAGDADQLKALVTKLTPSIATVRLVIKAQVKAGGQSNDHESKMRMQGVVVSPDGLVMISYAPFSDQRWSQAAKDSGAPDGFSMTITPTSFKVILNGDSKEYDAFLAATDTKLDLAFVQIEGLAGQKLPPVDFSAGVDPTVGQELAVISRLKKGYDYAPYFSLARACCEISKPRKAWMLDGNITELGLPIFTFGGQVVGVLTNVTSGSKDEDEESGTGDYGLSASGSADGGVFVVPAASVKSVIEQATKRAAEVAAERAAGKKPADTPGTAPGPAKPPANPPAKPPAGK